MPQEKSAGAVIFRKEGEKNFYLLLHYNSARPEQKKGGHWDFPKGHIEEGESEIQAVKREIKEETGIDDIKIIDGFKEWIKYFFRKTYGLSQEEKKKAPWIFKLVIFYLVQTKTEEVKISSEHMGYKWLSYEEALKQLTFKNAKEILKKANDFILRHKA